MCGLLGSRNRFALHGATILLQICAGISLSLPSPFGRCEEVSHGSSLLHPKKMGLMRSPRR